MQNASDLGEWLRPQRACYRDSLKRSIEEAVNANEGRVTQLANTLLLAGRIGTQLPRQQRERDVERNRYVAIEFNEARGSIREDKYRYKECMKL